MLPAADRALAEMMIHERFAARDVELIKQHDRQIVRCLRDIHSSAKLSHGDVKPLNILRDQQTRKLKLTDFDAAAPFGQPIGMKASTSSAYISPEEMRRLQSSGPPALASQSYDMWTLGVTMFEMLSGRKLFPTCSNDSDEIDPTAVSRLMNWEGLPNKEARHILSRCDVAMPPNYCEPCWTQTQTQGHLAWKRSSIIHFFSYFLQR